MKPEALKSFIEGIEHGFLDGRPSKEQWEAIKAKIRQLSDSPERPNFNVPRHPSWPLPLVEREPYSMEGEPLTAKFLELGE